MKQFLQRYWFLVFLAIVLFTGVCFPQGIRWGTHWVDKRIAVAIVLFLMSFSLDSKRLWGAVRQPAPALLAIIINIFGIPLLAWLCVKLHARMAILEDLSLGMLIAASVPCTLASAAVWTRKAAGDDGVALVVTVSTNLGCFVTTPLCLLWTTSRVVELTPGPMITKLALVVLLPTALGQLLRMHHPLASFATRMKVPMGVIGQGLILFVILIGAGEVGMRLVALEADFSWGHFLVIMVNCIFIHLAALVTGLTLGRHCGFSRSQQSAVAFASSQKTLPVGVYIATEVFGGLYPMAILPMITYHVAQLVLDTFIAERFAAQTSRDSE